jgi:nitroreductase
MADIAAVPGVVVVTQHVDADPHRAKEDYAAIFMGIENMLLVATSLGLGSKVHTGDIMTAPAMRELVKAEEDEEIVAMLHIGEAAEEMKPKPRIPAEERTRWIP